MDDAYEMCCLTDPVFDDSFILKAERRRRRPHERAGRLVLEVRKEGAVA